MYIRMTINGQLIDKRTKRALRARYFGTSGSALTLADAQCVRWGALAVIQPTHHWSTYLDNWRPFGGLELLTVR